MKNILTVRVFRGYSDSQLSEVRGREITDYQLPITNYQLPITNYRLPITNFLRSMPERLLPSDRLNI